MALTTLGLDRIEHRQSSGSTNYTDILVSALLQQSRGETISARALGSQEIAAGIISRALSLATVTGDRGLLTTRVLAEAARDLIVNGECAIQARRGPAHGRRPAVTRHTLQRLRRTTRTRPRGATT